MKSFADWFDPSERVHLTAWQVFRETGSWPPGFIPADVAAPTPAAVSETAMRISDRWAEQMIGKRRKSLGRDGNWVR